MRSLQVKNNKDIHCSRCILVNFSNEEKHSRVIYATLNYFLVLDHYIVLNIYFIIIMLITFHLEFLFYIQWILPVRAEINLWASATTEHRNLATIRRVYHESGLCVVTIRKEVGSIYNKVWCVTKIVKTLMRIMKTNQFQPSFQRLFQRKRRYLRSTRRS